MVKEAEAEKPGGAGTEGKEDDGVGTEAPRGRLEREEQGRGTVEPKPIPEHTTPPPPPRRKRSK